MRAGRCDEGTKRQRELVASEDQKRLKSDATIDAEVRNVANSECPSSTAKNDVDFVVRATHELGASARAKNVKECKSNFEKVFSKMKSADEESRRDRTSGVVSPTPWGPGHAVLTEGVKCIAEGTTCAEGLTYHKRQYCMQLRDMKGCEKTATENWQTQLKLGHITCK